MRGVVGFTGVWDGLDIDMRRGKPYLSKRGRRLSTCPISVILSALDGVPGGVRTSSRNRNLESLAISKDANHILGPLLFVVLCERLHAHNDLDVFHLSREAREAAEALKRGLRFWREN